MDLAQMFAQMGLRGNNISSMITKFRLKFQPLQLVWVLSQFNQLKDLEEKFTFIWKLPQTQECLALPLLLASTKSEDEAERYKTEGNIFFKKNNFDAALRCYNMAILLAPHPKLQSNSCGNANEQANLGNLDCRKFRTLGCSYANRSAVFLAMKNYDKCLQDIDLALRNGYPEILKRKLEERKQKCFDAQNEDLKSGKASPRLSSRKREPPALPQRSEIVPAFSSALKPAYARREGRHVVATRDIHPGEILGVEESLYTHIEIYGIALYCSVCLVSCNNPLPCPESVNVFCSDHCRTRALKDYHLQECRIFRALEGLGFQNPQWNLTLKMLIRTSFPWLKENLPKLKKEVKELPPEKWGSNEDGVYSADYRALYHMPTANSVHPGEDAIFKLCFASAVVTKLLHDRGNFFVNSLGMPIIPELEDFITTGTALLHHMMNPHIQMSLNATLDDTLGAAAPSLSSIGVGLFPSTMLLKHSCNPSAATYNIGNKMVVRSLNFIPAGKQITMAYGAKFDNEHKFFRQIKLKSLGIKCSCEACTNDWPQITALPNTITFKCLKCSKAVKESNCTCCDIDYERRDYDGEKKSLVEKWYANFYQFMQVEKHFKVSSINITTKQEVTNEDFDGVCKFIEFLDKNVELPCAAHLNARRLMDLYFLKQ